MPRTRRESLRGARHARSALIRGVALDVEEAKVTLDEVPDRPGIAASIFKAVAAEGIHVDMIVQNISHDGRTDLSFTIPRADVPRVNAVLESIVADVGALRFETDDAIAKLSLVGPGSTVGVAADMFDALAAEGINIEMISTSSIRISCVIRAEDGARFTRASASGSTARRWTRRPEPWSSARPAGR